MKPRDPAGVRTGPARSIAAQSRRGIVNEPEVPPRPSYNNLALDRVTVERCLIRIGYVPLPGEYSGRGALKAHDQPAVGRSEKV
jgi:hypothetical protein